MNNDIPKKLKSLRKHLGLTQGEFSDKINLKQSTYSMIENGNNNLSIDILNDIIKNYNVDANYFFTNIDIADIGNSIVYDNIKYSFNDLFLDYRKTVDNLSDIAYMIDRINSDYLTEDKYKQLLELDSYDIGVIFDILDDKRKQKDIESTLSKNIITAKDLLREFIIDLHVLSIGGKIGSQAHASLKDLYDQYLDIKHSENM